MRSQPLSKQLLKFVKSADFRGCNSSLKEKDWADLTKFITATMDEVRLFHAERFSKRVLERIELDDSSFFRDAVLKREIGSAMEFEKQRDHAAHTLHNYLLGWFIFLNSEPVSVAFGEHFKKRLGGGPLWWFSNVWPISSLLHDIGYLFEGGLSPKAIERSNENAKAGAEYVNEFFSHHFYVESGVNTYEERKYLQERVGRPDIDPHSLVTISDSLKRIPSVEFLNREFAGAPVLPTDAFDLWRENYRFFENSTMAERVGQLATAHETLIRDGLPEVAVRILDHGIAGALIQLQISVHWYEIYCLLPQERPDDPLAARVWDAFRGPLAPDDAERDPSWLWQGAVWGTAAVAFHNVAQSKHHWPGCEGQKLQISLSDDPLTYLGILVDVLQEWDRYTMSRDSVFTGEEHLPLQAQDVNLGVDRAGRIRVRFPDAVCKKVEAGLNNALIGWSELVDIIAKT